MRGKMKLQDIAEVMIGVLAKRENDKNGENSYLLFSLKNYEEGINFEEYKTNKNLDNKVAQKGDLLFRLLYPNKIIYVDEKIEGTLVPSQFCIIRTNKNYLDPIVLKWYLESNMANVELNSKITGSIIKTMPVASLKTLNIPYVSKDNQEDMKTLILLWKKEEEISREILNEKNRLYNYYLEKMITKENSLKE